MCMDEGGWVKDLICCVTGLCWVCCKKSPLLSLPAKDSANPGWHKLDKIWGKVQGPSTFCRDTYGTHNVKHWTGWWPGIWDWHYGCHVDQGRAPVNMTEWQTLLLYPLSVTTKLTLSYLQSEFFVIYLLCICGLENFLQAWALMKLTLLEPF